MTNPINWFEIYVQDMKRAKHFYETVFQRKLEQLGNPELEMWSFTADMNDFGAGGALVKMEGMPSGGNSTIIYFSCADCADESGRVETAGGHMFKPKFSIGQYGYIALATDTEGNMFGMHSMQ